MSEPVVVVAVDGLDWRELRDGVAAGCLPHLAALLEDGAYAEVDVGSCVPALVGAAERLNSPTLWTTVATGQYYFQHGVYDFSNLLDSAESPPLFESRHVGSPRIWDVLSAYGRSSLVAGYYVTYPAYPLRGIMVSDLFGETEARDAVWPQEQADPLARLLGSENYASYVAAQRDAAGAELLAPHTAARPAPVSPGAAARWREILRRFTRLDPSQIEELLESPACARTRKVVGCRLIYPLLRDERFHRVFTHLVGGRAWDFAVVYYRLVDFVSHGFWVRGVSVPEDFVRAYGTVIAEAYRWVDERVGDLRRTLPPAARLLVLSDHGFAPADRPQRPEEQPNVWEFSNGRHSEPAVLICHGGPRRGPIQGLSLLDVAPTILDHFGVPLAQALDGGPAPGLLSATQTSKGASVEAYAYTRPARAGGLTAREREQVVERLEALGYL